MESQKGKLSEIRASATADTCATRSIAESEVLAKAPRTRDQLRGQLKKKMSAPASLVDVEEIQAEELPRGTKMSPH
jgi:hypothetical protein